jgi:D-xylose transport system permease protein
MTPAAEPRPAPRGALWPRGWAKSLSLGEAGIYYALALIFVALTALTIALGARNFLDPANLANILYQSSYVAIIAVPSTLVLISGNFDLSVGAIAALCAASVLLLSDIVGIYPAIAISLGAGAVIGLLNAAIVEGIGINPFIVTLATMTALRGLLLIITGGHTAAASDREALGPLQAIENGTWTCPNLLWMAAVAAFALAAFVWWRQRRAGAVVGCGAAGLALVIAGFFAGGGWVLAKPVYYMAAVTAAAWFVLRFTIIGRRLQASGANIEAARLVGVRVRRYKVVPFVLNGLAAAFVGLLFAARLGAVLPNAMTGMELTAIAAAILGGTSLFGGSGSVLKSVAGAVVLFSLENGFDLVGLGSSYQGVIEGVVLIIAAAVYTVGQRRR